ncbi:MAG: hypothetical protein RBS73_01165 [Prolixibacteraceae bacterium]|jgi:hypothetical protein|nr:hypothetical protein [Prolixibacteraceae bacterium]
MANVIIGIHGLGNKPPRTMLENWWKLAMIEGLENANLKTVLPKFEMVYWADVMYDRPLDESETHVESPYFLDEKYVKGMKVDSVEDHSLRMKVVDFLGRQLNRIFLNEDFTLNYSFITDTLVRKYFRDLEIYYSEGSAPFDSSGQKAKDLIRGRLLQVLEKYHKDNIMLIAHSMGSIIAFDVLTFLAPHLNIHTLVTIGSPLGLPIVVSKIAAEQKQIKTQENHMVTPPGIVGCWYNFSDIQDGVAFDYKLSDNFMENSYGVKPADFLVRNDYAVNGVSNPHKSFGYLRTPEFAGLLNEFILSEKLTLKEKLVRRSSQFISRFRSFLEK